MRNVLLTTAAAAALLAAQPTMAEPLTLNNQQLDDVTAGGQHEVLNLNGRGREGVITNRFSPSRASTTTIVVAPGAGFISQHQVITPAGVVLSTLHEDSVTHSTVVE